MAFTSTLVELQNLTKIAPFLKSGEIAQSSPHKTKSLFNILIFDFVCFGGTCKKFQNK